MCVCFESKVPNALELRTQRRRWRPNANETWDSIDDFGSKKQGIGNGGFAGNNGVPLKKELDPLFR